MSQRNVTNSRKLTESHFEKPEQDIVVTVNGIETWPASFEVTEDGIVFEEALSPGDQIVVCNTTTEQRDRYFTVKRRTRFVPFDSTSYLQDAPF